MEEQADEERSLSQQIEFIKVQQETAQRKENAEESAKIELLKEARKFEKIQKLKKTD